MPVLSGEAKRLLTTSEFELFRQTAAREIAKHPRPLIRSKISHARRLRDKYRDLAQQQKGEARGKRSPKGSRPATDNRRTVVKVEIFEIILDRLEKRLKRMLDIERKEIEKRKLESQKIRKAVKESVGAAPIEKVALLKKEASDKPAAKTKKSTPKKKEASAKPASKTKSNKSPMAVGSARGPAGSKASMLPKRAASGIARNKTASAHMRASQKRTQARRDSRG